MKHALLLNFDESPLEFITERRLLELLCRNKIQVVHTWDNSINFGINKEIKQPSVVKLNYYVKSFSRAIRFNRLKVFSRDQYICAYCRYQCTSKDVSLEHIIPRFLGGESSWTNCITACKDCNKKKKNRTPEQAGMKLLNQPYVPKFLFDMKKYKIEHKFPYWDFYLSFLPN